MGSRLRREPEGAPGRAAAERREALLDAAHAAFARTGFRRTSMEDVAREAGVSRAALYLHFRNKEEIFRSLSEGLHRDALAGAAEALAEGGSIGDRVLSALEAKSLRFVELVAASPHGAELVETSSRVCGDIAAAKEERFAKLLADALRRAAEDGELDLEGAGVSAAAAAELLVQASHGLKASAASPALYRRRLADLVRVLLAGLGASG
jgi:AcrR family transcriptional regulator